HQVLFHSDTVQCMGQMRYNLSELPVHFVTASAHKFNGPKGVGFLYIKNGVKIPPHIHGGSQERGLRAGTENLPFIAGMAFALEKACSQLEEKRAKLLSLKQYMQQQLQRHIPGVSFNGPTAENEALPTVLNVAFPCGEEDAMLTFHLDLAGISASGGSACSSGSNQGSHVLAGIGCSKARAMNSVRFSFGPQNTPEEIDYTVQKLREIIKAPVM
ncbi:MAG: aminotransferase class V-fold PLP-dependent enzyme, partial [Bacteroidetes bacterium]